MSKLKDIYITLSNLGIRPYHNDEQVRSKKVLNKIILAGVPFHFPFMILFYQFDFFYIYMQVLCVSILISASLYLCYLSKNNLALMIDVFLHVASVGSIGYMIKEDVGAIYVMLSVGLVPLFVLDHSKKFLFGYLSFLIGSCTFLIVFDLDAQGIYEMAHEQARLMKTFSIIEFISFIALLVYYYNAEGRVMRKKIVSQQKSLAQSSRLADLGIMAAGVAHEINNPLSIISGSAALLERTDLSLVQTKNIKKIKESTERISAIVNGLRHVARDGSQDDFILEDFSSILQQVESVTKQKLSHMEVEFSVDLEENLPQISCRSVQVSQVLINLFSNALYAIKDLDEKWIKIRAFSKDRHVVIEFIDSGHGISDEVADNIFVAFFTSKPIGDGLGLGLSISHSIMQEHAGDLRINSSHEHTCFELSFPLAEEKHTA